MMKDNNETFRYTYSASQQEEIRSIRQKYVEPQEDKMAQLRRLDQSASRKGLILSLSAGIVGVLLLGLGMSCATVWMGSWFVPGIVIGVIGIVLIAAAYPLYVRVTERERKKIAPEILRLTDELMKG
ncbi:MAG: hypothetical protein ACI4PC_02420 [Oscillospiraceae bacterium]